MKCYLSSAIYGHEMEDIQQRFREMKAMVLDWGWEPVSPLDVEPLPHEGECPAGRKAVSHAEHTDTCNLRADIKAMLDCDAVLFDSNWQSSWGARSELQVAGVVGLKVMFVAKDEGLGSFERVVSV